MNYLWPWHNVGSNPSACDRRSRAIGRTANGDVVKLDFTKPDGQLCSKGKDGKRWKKMGKGISRKGICKGFVQFVPYQAGLRNESWSPPTEQQYRQPDPQHLARNSKTLSTLPHQSLDSNEFGDANILIH